MNHGSLTVNPHAISSGLRFKDPTHGSVVEVYMGVRVGLPMRWWMVVVDGV